MEKTLALVKPGTTNNAEFIVDMFSRIEDAGFKPRDKRLLWLTKTQVSKFYEVHKDKPFFNGLVNYMSSGEIFLVILEKENAIEDWRKIIGATDPAKADPESLRGKYGNKEVIRENCVHGSDSKENAEREIRFFFGDVSLID